MRVREPVARPLDVVAVELALTAAQAFLVGVLLYLAVGFWDDAGVGLGSVAAILLLLGLAVGGGWLYWLAGGVGWPMAGANLAAAVFLVSALVLGWSGETFRLDGVPLLLATAAAVFGAAAGVFLASPRRWPWDERRRPRSGTSAPHVSPTTRAFVARIPRSLPRRKPTPEPVSELAARIGQAAPVASARPEPAAMAVAGPPASLSPADPSITLEAAPPPPAPEPALTDAPTVAGSPLTVPQAPEPVLPTARLARASARPSPAAEEADANSADADGGIVLPTMIEPKAQRSPWAWAAPPEWSRDEDDEPVSPPSRRA